MAVNARLGFTSQFAKTVSSTALSLTDLGFTTAQVQQAQSMRLTVETQSTRYAYDGATPTAANGHLLAANAELLLVGSENLANFRIIRVTTDATIQVTLEA